MKNKLVFLLALSVFTGTSLLAQKSIYIEYDPINPTRTRIGYVDANNDTVFQNKRPLAIKGPTPCNIRFLNYNREALRAEGTMRKGPNLDSVSMANVSSFLGSTLGILVPNVGINLGNLLPKSRGPASPRNAAPLEMIPLHPNFDLLEPPFENQESVLVKYDTLIREKIADINRWKIILNQLNKLRYNTTFSANETKQKSISLIGTLAIDAPTVLKNEIKSQAIVRKLARENADYLQIALLSFEKEVANAPRGISNVVDEYELAKENIKAYQQYVNGNTEEDVRNILTQTAESYQAILNNPFELNMSLIIDEKTDLLQLNTYRLNDGNQKIPKQLVNSQPFFVKTPGGMAILNTIGIGLIQFKEPVEKYAVSASKIVSTPSDQVLPAFSFYLHFVSRGRSPLKLGGHFGVGLPLTESKSVNFQFGPTIVIGSQNAICINLGMATGRVTRLSDGLKVGDTYSASSALPTINRYEWGYQIGLSFNIAGFFKK